MGRCRCGAALVPDLHFCVACGARQDVGPRVPASAAPAAPSSGAPPFGPDATGRAPYPAPRPTPPPSYPYPGPPAVVPVPMVAAPVAPVRSTVPWIVAGVSIVVAVVLVAVGVLAARPAVIFGAAAPTPVAAPTVTVGVPVPAVASSRTGTSSGSTTSSSGGTSSTAGASLAAQVAADRPTVEGLVGQWVPQLSSKRAGMVADGITYDDDAILAHYSSLLARDPSAVMLYSGDWPVFNGADYWVVVHPQAFSTAAAANAWCDAQGYSADDCLAKKLSHTGGTSGTTVPRH